MNHTRRCRRISLSGAIVSGIIFGLASDAIAAPLPLPDPLGASHSVGTSPSASVKPDTASRTRISEAYGKLPLSFEVNQGQTDEQVRFLARGSGYTLFLTPTESVLSLKTEGSGLRTEPPTAMRRAVVRMKVVGANTEAKLEGLDELPGKSNYFIGNDPKKWRTNIPHYGKVRYHEAYPGVDLVFYGNPRQLEYDFVIAPGANPNDITLAFEGVNRLEIDNEGNLILHTAGGHLIQRTPVIYQEINGARQAVTGHYVLRDKNRIGVHVAAYDRTRPLIIDPVLVYSTFLGGGNADIGNGIAVDGAGNAYITGSTASADDPGTPAVDEDFPTTAGTFQTALATPGFTDAFVTKLNTTGTALVYSTYLGGASDDVGNGIAVDGAGNAYITGSTASADNPGTPLVNEGFPTTPGAFQTALANAAGVRDAFVTKLNTTGTALVYSTYLGGARDDVGNGIAVDGAIPPSIYVTGSTASVNFPVSPNPGAFQTALADAPAVVTDAFVTKLNPAGAGMADLVYSTYLGGVGADIANGIAVDAAGNAYVTGVTASGGVTPFPTAGALAPFDNTFNGIQDAFVTKLNSTGTMLVYSTFLGGTAEDVGRAIAIDGVGNAYITGDTRSDNFPTAGSPFQAARAGLQDAFVTKLNATGTGLAYSTYLGGSQIDIGYGIDVDPLDNAYVTGETGPAGVPTPFPTTAGAFDTTSTDVIDAFIAKLME